MKRHHNFFLIIVALAASACNGLDSDAASSAVSGATVLSAEEAQAQAEQAINAANFDAELEALEKELAADESGN